MHFEWLATEHYRLHRVEEWPDSPHKEAALGAIRSSLASLERNLPADISGPRCEVCLSRPQSLAVLEFPIETSETEQANPGLAA